METINSTNDPNSIARKKSQTNSIGGLAGMELAFNNETNPNFVPEYLRDSPLVSLFTLGDQHVNLSPPNHAHASSIASSESIPNKLIPLPSVWNQKDKCNLLELQRGNLRVNYMGQGRTDADAASVRSNHPIPAECGIYYFEIEILSRGREGYIGIGLSGQGVSLNRLPGWEQNSWGYHGDDGHIFQCSGTGKPYGPTYTTGDVVGCGINMLTKTVFFTRNGIHLGTAFRDIRVPLLATGNASPRPLYPSVGMRTPGEAIQTNFGQLPFRFSIESYVADERRKVWQSIRSVPTSPQLDVAVYELILGYLVHHGYQGTATALLKARQARSISMQGNAMEVDNMGSMGDSLVVQDMEQRAKIRNAILNGQIEASMKMMNQWYPGFLEQDTMTRFQCQCQVFLELIAQMVHELKNPTLSAANLQEKDSIVPSVEATKSDSSKLNNASHPLLLAALRYGQTTLAPYDKSDSPLLIRQQLRDVYSVIAYPDPTLSRVSHLLDLPTMRHRLAELVNASILVFGGHPRSPPLLLVIKQAIVTGTHLAIRHPSSVPESTLIHIMKDILTGL